MKQDIFLNNADKLWLWMKHKQLFSSIDLSRYGLQFYYLRAGRTARDWAIPKERTNIEPRLNRLSTNEKRFRGLLKNGNANIAYYEINPKHNGGLGC